MTITYKPTQEKYIFSYRDKNKELKFMYRLYLGKDKLTGVAKNTTKRNFDSIKEAREARERARANHDMEQTGQSICFNEVAQLWLKYYEKKVEPSTYGKTAAIFKNHIYPILNNREIKSVTVEDCEHFIDTFSERLVNFEQVGHYTSRVFRFACKHNLLEKNPFDSLDNSEKKGVSASRKKPKKIDVRRKYYEAKEIVEILHFLEHNAYKHVYVFFRVLALTGCRKSEILALTWNDIDFVNKKIHILRSVTFAKDVGIYLSDTKGHTSRSIAIDEETLNLLKIWKNEQKTQLTQLNIKVSKNQLLFPNKNNTLMYPTKTEPWLKNAKKNLHFSKYVKFTPHTFRHSYATLCAEKEIPIPLIQKRLGHSCKENTTSKYYIHFTDADDRKICEKYAALLDAAKQDFIQTHSL